MSLSALLAAMSESPVILMLTVLFAAVCGVAAYSYFYVMRPKAGTIEWIRLYQKDRADPFQLESLTLGDLTAFLLSVFVSEGVCTIRLLVHLERGYIRSAQEDALSMALYGILLLFVLCACFFFLFRMFFGNKVIAISLTALACGLCSFDIAAPILLTASLTCLYIWICLNNRQPKLMDPLWLMLSGLLYGICLMVCWASLYLIPIYIGGYIAGKVRQWHQGDLEKRKGRLLVSCLSMLICVAVGTIVLWLLYYVYTNDHIYFWNAVISGETYESIIPTLLMKISDITAPRDQNISTMFKDIYIPILFVASLPPLIHGIRKKRSSHAMAIGFCLIPFLLMWIISGVELMTPVYMLCIGWMFKGFVDRGYKYYTILISAAVILFYFLRLLLL